MRIFRTRTPNRVVCVRICCRQLISILMLLTNCWCVFREITTMHICISKCLFSWCQTFISVYFAVSSRVAITCCPDRQIITTIALIRNEKEKVADDDDAGPIAMQDEWRKPKMLRNCTCSHNHERLQTRKQSQETHGKKCEKKQKTFPPAMREPTDSFRLWPLDEGLFSVMKMRIQIKTKNSLKWKWKNWRTRGKKHRQKWEKTKKKSAHSPSCTKCEEIQSLIRCRVVALAQGISYPGRIGHKLTSGTNGHLQPWRLRFV